MRGSSNVTGQRFDREGGAPLCGSDAIARAR